MRLHKVTQLLSYTAGTLPLFSEFLEKSRLSALNTNEMFLIILNVIPKSGIFFSPKYQLYKHNLVTLALDSEERNNLIEK